MLRKLTARELEKIRKAKKTANSILTPQRREINKQIKELRKSSALGKYTKMAELENELEKLRPITGNPIMLFVGGQTMMVDYNRLKKIDRTLPWKKGWRYTKVRIQQERQQTWPNQIAYLSRENDDASIATKPVLHLTYVNVLSGVGGSLEMYELPNYQRELLTDLPVIEVCQRG